MFDMLKIAQVLEAAAEHIDSIEAAKIAAVAEEKKSIINSLASKFAEATGEEMPEIVRNKLATSDKDVVDLVKSMIEKQASNVDSLGKPSDHDVNDRTPTSIKEAASIADDRFVDWIINK